MKGICRFLQQMITNSNLSRINPNSLGTCPKCDAPIIEGKKGFGCSKWKEGCTFVLWREFQGIHLGYHQIQQLLQKKIILPPIKFLNGEKAIVTLSPQGVVTSLPLIQ